MITEAVFSRAPWWRRLAAGHDLRLVPAAAIVWLATLLGDRLSWQWALGCGLAGALIGLAFLVRVRWRGRRDPNHSGHGSR
ncbi:MAG TPA: hypothetical protein VG317_01585, partial [Pseudonocardiaceae bacterium]|nr:hypothetical protein [Pseudonocardiaceae bacterium]